MPQAIVFAGDLVGLVGGYVNGGSSWVSRTTDGGATWASHSIAPTYVGNAVDLDFGSATRCYAALYGGIDVNFVYASTDAGATWFPASNGLSASVRLDAIDFLDATTGYVAGGNSNAAIYRTTDGGQSWSPVGQNGLQSGMIRDMHWFDAQTGLVTSFSGIHRTTNGGGSWTRVNADDNLDLSFRDSQVGYACDALDAWVWRTSDAGVTWEQIDLPWTEGPERVAATAAGFVTVGTASVILTAELPEPAAISPIDPPGGAPAVVSGELGAGVSVRASGLFAAGGPVVVAIDATRARDRSTPPTGAVFAAGGRHVALLDVRALGPGVWAATWDGQSRGRAAARGVYFIALERGGHRASLKSVRTP
jgi:photosystem II stability/assembly factor-like uncharacterized protein